MDILYSNIKRPYDDLPEEYLSGMLFDTEIFNVHVKGRQMDVSHSNIEYLFS